MNNANISKSYFLVSKPKTVILFENNTEAISSMVSEISSVHEENKAVVISGNKETTDDLIFYIKNSSLVVLGILNGIDKRVEELINMLPKDSFVILDSYNEKVKELKSRNSLNVLTFGKEGIGDVKFVAFESEDINNTSFKIDYKGSIVPFYLNEGLNKGDLTKAAILPSITISLALGLNLVQISQGLKKIKEQ